MNETIGDLTTLPADTGASVGNAMATRNSSGAVLRKPATVVEALTNIDATLGQIHGLKNGHSNLKADAIHLACAESAGCDWFFTVDKGILKKASSIGTMRVANPVQFIQEDSMQCDRMLHKLEDDFAKRKKKIVSEYRLPIDPEDEKTMRKRIEDLKVEFKTAYEKWLEEN